jgi:hypothetical protein
MLWASTIAPMAPLQHGEQARFAITLGGVALTARFPAMALPRFIARHMPSPRRRRPWCAHKPFAREPGESLSPPVVAGMLSGRPEAVADDECDGEVGAARGSDESGRTKRPRPLRTPPRFNERTEPVTIGNVRADAPRSTPPRDDANRSARNAVLWTPAIERYERSAFRIFAASWSRRTRCSAASGSASICSDRLRSRALPSSSRSNARRRSPSLAVA